MPLDPDRLPLPEVPRALLREFGTAPDYNAVWRLVTTGRVPSDRRGSRLLVLRADLPRIAELLGLVRRPDAA